MNDSRIIGGLLIFTAGVAIGAVSAFYYVKDKYKAIADEEIKAMELYYESKVKSARNEGRKEALWEPITKESDDADDIIRNQGYNNEKEEDKMAKKEHPGEVELPYSITPEQFDNPENMHQTMSLSFNPDMGVLVDDLTNEEVDISNVGKENLDLFANSGEDTMYIRNDLIGTDFEIIKVEEDYVKSYADFEA